MHNAAALQTTNAYPLPFSTRPYGRTPDDIPEGTTFDGWSPRNLLNIDPPPPPGWYSIPHWMGLTEWEILIGGGNETPLAQWVAGWRGEEADRASALAAAEGFEPLEWPAPPLIAEAGCPTVPLFPDPILREYWSRIA